MGEGGDQSIMTPAPASSRRKTQQKLAKNSKKKNPLLVHREDSLDKGSEWWDGAGGFAHSQQFQGTSGVAPLSCLYPKTLELGRCTCMSGNKSQSRELAAWQDVVFIRELQEQGTGQL